MVEFLTEKDLGILETVPISDYTKDLILKIFFNFGKIPKNIKAKLKSGFDGNFEKKIRKSFEELTFKEILKLGYFLFEFEKEYSEFFLPIVYVLNKKAFELISFNSDFKNSNLQGLFNNIFNFVVLMRINIENINDKNECIECLKTLDKFGKSCNYK